MKIWLPSATEARCAHCKKRNGLVLKARMKSKSKKQKQKQKARGRQGTSPPDPLKPFYLKMQKVTP
ncbi:MAG: hypothetical protein HQL51_15460 [Magnetococcales bacterium]|nr:hypothetical protein [Magnetococcales bacterium]